MPFSPAVLKQIADEIDPECFYMPEPAAPANAYDLLKNYHFMDINGKPVSMQRLNQPFTLSFGVSGCSLYCSNNNRALALMDEKGAWHHVVINSNPEHDARSQQFRTEFYQSVVKDPAGTRNNVKNVIVLFPTDANNRPSNAEASRLQNSGFEAYTNSKNPKAHDPAIRTFDKQGCQTGEFEATHIFSNNYKIGKGCSR